MELNVICCRSSPGHTVFAVASAISHPYHPPSMRSLSALSAVVLAFYCTAALAAAASPFSLFSTGQKPLQAIHADKDDGKPVPGDNPLRTCPGQESSEYIVIEHVNLKPNPPQAYELILISSLFFPPARISLGVVDDEWSDPCLENTKKQGEMKEGPEEEEPSFIWSALPLVLKLEKRAVFTPVGMALLSHFYHARSPSTKMMEKDKVEGQGK